MGLGFRTANYDADIRRCVVISTCNGNEISDGQWEVEGRISEEIIDGDLFYTVKWKPTLIAEEDAKKAFQLIREWNAEKQRTMTKSETARPAPKQTRINRSVPIRTGSSFFKFVIFIAYCGTRVPRIWYILDLNVCEVLSTAGARGNVQSGDASVTISC